MSVSCCSKCQWNCRELLHYIIVELCGFTYFAKHFQLWYIFIKTEHFESFKKRSWTRNFDHCRPRFDFFRRATLLNCVTDHWEYSHLFWRALCLSLLYLKGLHQPLEQFEALIGKRSGSRKSDCIIIMTDRSAVSVSIRHGASMKKKASHVISLR